MKIPELKHEAGKVLAVLWIKDEMVTNMFLAVAHSVLIMEICIPSLCVLYNRIMKPPYIHLQVLLCNQNSHDPW